MVMQDLEVEFPVRDLLLALQGFPGNLFQIEEESKTCKKNFSVKDNALSRFLVHPSEILLAKQFLEIASNHYTIQEYIGQRHKYLGQYVTRFTDGIINSMKPYSSCLDSIGKEIFDEKSPTIALTKFHEVFAFEDFFRRLKSLVIKYTEHEITMNEMLSEVYSNSSSCSASETRHGFSVIFHSVQSAFLEDSWSWMTTGSINEINRDVFFIRKTTGKEATFRLTHDVPSVISPRVAEKILFIGNLVRHFSRRDWKDYKQFSPQLNPVFTVEDVDQFFVEFVQLKETKPFNESRFFSFVESIRVKAAAFSSKYVLETEDIVGHFECIKDILLTGNEKVWIFFLEEIKKTTLGDKWKEEKKDRVLRSILESILLKLYCNQDVVDECLSDITFSFHLKEDISYADGTTIKPVIPFFFRIDYKLPSLSKKIIQDKFLVKYQSIFNFFLELLETRLELSASWKESSSGYKKRAIASYKQRSQGKGLSDKSLKGISRGSVLRHKVLFFLEHLYFYLKVNVIEETSIDFVHVLRTCQDYEQMQMKHSLFVGNLMRETFLDYPAVSVMIRRLFSVSHDLCCLKENNEDYESDLEKIDKEMKGLFSDLNILFNALKEYRFHSSLGQLLLQLSAD